MNHKITAYSTVRLNTGCNLGLHWQATAGTASSTCTWEVTVKCEEKKVVHMIVDQKNESTCL